MNGPQNMASYGMTIQGLLGKDLLSLSMPEFKDDLKSSISVKNLKDLGNTQGSDPTSAYLGGYQKRDFQMLHIYQLFNQMNNNQFLSGPKLWDSTISLPFDLDPFGVSDIQDVLVENDIKVQR